MAKLSELIEPNKLSYLKHPQFSLKISKDYHKFYKVTWDGNWLYVYDVCEKPLLVSVLTLFDSQWEKFDSNAVEAENE